MDGTGLLFGPLIEALGGRIKTEVTAYPSASPLSYEELLPTVAAALPREAPYILLGESFSGPLAIMAASSNPPNLKALILVATFIRNPVRWLPRCAAALAKPPIFRLSKPFVVAKSVLAGYGSNGVTGLVSKAHSKVTPAVMAARAKAILSVDVEEELKSVKAPLFLLRGASDKVVPRSASREIERARPDIRSFAIPGPHLVLQAAPSQSASVICQIVDVVK